MTSSEPTRITEWSSKRLDCDQKTRRAIVQAAEAWRLANRLPASPLRFEGADGSNLVTRQYVGVVSVSGLTIEIYPKLDRAALAGDIDTAPRDTIMSNLLWMLHVADRQAIHSADAGALGDIPARFIDVFALLLAQNLLREFEAGICRRYVSFEGDRRTVRGRVLLREQLTTHWNRMDRVACAWDELTPDIPLFRLLKCACRELQPWVTDFRTRQLLADCVAALDEVSDVSVDSALNSAARAAWDHVTERYRRSFELARRLLRGRSHELAAGDRDTFVFLIDMNLVFQEYVHAVLETAYGVAVERQKYLGRLLGLAQGGIHQFADFYWRTKNETWIGDAKYKSLAGDPSKCAYFEKLNAVDDAETSAGCQLSPDDIRQLTVYGGLEAMPSGRAPKLCIFYPYIGAAAWRCDSADTWNGCRLTLAPVKVTESELLVDRIPSLDD